MNIDISVVISGSSLFERPHPPALKRSPIALAKITIAAWFDEHHRHMVWFEARETQCRLMLSALHRRRRDAHDGHAPPAAAEESEEPSTGGSY